MACNPVLHVVVVGFHHKKGAQVEYSYPPLVDSESHDSPSVPTLWKNLPSLALPDGAHNYDKDTVYFHLPSLTDERSTVFGVSCYRQVDAKDVRNKGSDVTRNSIQKCVCVLSRLPLYGLVEAKLEMITYAWFKEKDFTQVSILEETYRQLQASCTQVLLEGSQVFLGLSCRDLVIKLRHKIVMLFKLMLLERKTLIYGSPAKPVCTTLLSLLSLFPEMVEYGLKESAAYSANRMISPSMKNVRLDSASEEFLEIHFADDKNVSGGELKNEDIKDETEKHNTHQRHNDNHVESGKESYQSQTNLETSDSLKDQSNNSLLSSQQPSPIYEKSENELSEKTQTESTQCSEKDRIFNSHLSGKQSSTDDLEKEHLSHKTQTQNSESNKNETSDESIAKNIDKDLIENHPVSQELESSPRNTVVNESGDGESYEKSLHPNPPFVTLTTQPQPTNLQPMKVEPNPGIHEQHSSTNKTSAGLLSQTISKDTLASEGTASDFGPSSQMEELLFDEQTEDCFSWHDDKLMLAIDHIGTGHMADHFDGRLTFEPEETKEMKEMDMEETKRNAGMARMDSTTSRTSQGSLTSMASDLGEAGARVFNDMRSRLTSLWDSTASDGIEEGDLTRDADVIDITQKNDVTDIPEVHHFEKQHSNSSDSTSVDASKSPRGSPQKSQEDTSSKDSSPAFDLTSLTSLTIDECGFPLAVFTKSVLCHPYLSLQYYDLLQDVNVRGFLIGASNMLFRQKKHLLDVIIELPDLSVTIHDETLRRQLVLSTADLRFADYLVKSVCGEMDDEAGHTSVFDESEWEGGDEWLRSQFKLYLASLLVTVKRGDEKMKEDFNPVFVHAFKTTHCYKVWASVERRGLNAAPPGHPFQGQLSMQDIRMRIAQNERGKRIMDAAGQTGKVAVQTGKAIGGALTTAKSAVSSTVGGWFSNIRKWSTTEEPVIEN